MDILIPHRLVGYIEGGNETHIKELAERLAERGHDIDIVTSEGRTLTQYRSKLSIRKVPRVGKYPPISYADNRFQFILEYAIFLGLAFLKFIVLSLQGKRYDLISVHSFFESYLARFIRSFSGIPYVSIIEGWSEMREAKHANIQIAISYDIVKKCQMFYGFKPVFIPKGIDSKRFNSNIKGHDIRRKYAKANEKLVLTVCRLDPRKDLPTLILAARKICEKECGIKFIIIGDGSERKNIEKMIEELDLSRNVKLVGYIPFSDGRLPKFYRAADVFVLPTLYEGFGFVLAEAMSSGIPVISNKVGAVPEVVGNCGILIDPGNPDLLAEKILEVLNDEEMRRKMIDKGLQEVRKYNWNQLIIEYERAFKSAIKKSARHEN